MTLKVIKQCSEAELKTWAEIQWEEFTSLMNEAVLFLPANYQTVSYNHSEFSVDLVDGLVTVNPTPFQAATVKGITERPGWGITTWKATDETEDSASEFVPYEEFQSCHNIGAVYYSVRQAFEIAVQDWVAKQKGSEHDSG